MMPYYYSSYGFDYGILGFFWHILSIAFWVFVILFIFRMFRRSRRYRHMENKSALELLKERYAKGEIDTTEYEERKKVLMNS